MAVLLGGWLRKRVSATPGDAEAEAWLVLRLVLRSVAILGLIVGLLIAILHAFVRLCVRSLSE